MPKKKIMSNIQSVPERPQRNMKAKVVFDPSDVHIPKKKPKYSFKYDNHAEDITVKKYEGKTNQGTIKKKSFPVKRVNESLNYLSAEINKTYSTQRINVSLNYLSAEIDRMSSTHSSINSPKQSYISDVCQEDYCFACSTYIQQQDLVDCVICMIKAHKHCLIITNPIWKFKLDQCPWLCDQCKKQHCSKCLKDESQSELKRRCITCEVGLHIECYESYDIKPLQKIDSELYICIPCITLATQKMPEEDENDGSDDDDDDDDNRNEEDAVESCTSNISTVKSYEEYDTDRNSLQSCTSSDEENNGNNLPNVSHWKKEQVLDYLKKYLPQEAMDQINKYDLDGNVLGLMKRKHFLYKMGLKLGHALTLYKQIRILQTQSTYGPLFWE